MYACNFKAIIVNKMVYIAKHEIQIIKWGNCRLLI
jgi:hypothetical protein